MEIDKNSVSFYQYHYYLPKLGTSEYDDETPSNQDEEHFLRGLSAVKALACEDDARIQGNMQSVSSRRDSLSLPTWLKLWYNAPGIFLTKSRFAPLPGQTLLHYLVDRTFTHSLREVLNAAQEWFSAETKQRLDALGSGQEYGLLAGPGSVVPSLRGFVDAQDFAGQTALHVALSKENYEMVRLLIVYGASPWFRNPADDLLPIQIADKLRGFEKEHQARMAHKRKLLGGADPGDLGVFLHHVGDNDGDELTGGEVDSRVLENPNASACQCFGMIEAYPQAYTRSQQEAQPFGVIATNYFMWESQRLVEAVQRRNYQEAIFHAKHRCVRSCLFTTMALTLRESCQPGSQLEGSVDSSRARTMIVRWCLAALSADPWNEKAKDLLIQTLEDIHHPLTSLLASEVRLFFSAKSMGSTDINSYKDEAIFRHQLAALRALDETGDSDDEDRKSTKTSKSGASIPRSYSSALLSSLNTSESGESELLFPGAKHAADALNSYTVDGSVKEKEPTVQLKPKEKSVVDEISGDVSVFVRLKDDAPAQKKPQINQQSGIGGSGVWVTLPHSSSETVEIASHGVVRAEVTLGFPYQTGELVVFEPSKSQGVDSIAGRRKFLRPIRGSTASLPVSVSAQSTVPGISPIVTLKNYVKIWGISCDDAIEVLTNYEWPVVSLTQLLQPGPRSCWCSLLRGRYGEQLWVSRLDPEVEQVFLEKVSPFRGEDGIHHTAHLGVGMVEWRPQYARKVGMEPGRLLLYDQRTLRFVSMLPEGIGVEKI